MGLSCERRIRLVAILAGHLAQGMRSHSLGGKMGMAENLLAKITVLLGGIDKRGLLLVRF